MNEFTVSVWVALDAYPYGIADLASHADKSESWYLGVDSRGRPGFRIKGSRSIVSNVKLPLWKWTQVAVTVKDGQAHLYIDGKLTKSGTVDSTISLPAAPVVLGRNREKTRCSNPVRGDEQNLPLRMGIQGLMDEVSVFKTALTAEQIKKSYTAFAPSDPTSDLAKGVLPGRLGVAKKFGASYTSLKFSDVWDGIFRDQASSAAL
jgi:hypothetical protein